MDVRTVGELRELLDNPELTDDMDILIMDEYTGSILKSFEATSNIYGGRIEITIETGES